MIVDRKQRCVRHRTVIAISFAIFLILCQCLFAGCSLLGGQPSTDKPLTQPGGASNEDATPTATLAPGAKVAPIEVQADQSNLTAYAGSQMSLTITTSPFAICNFVISYGLAVPSRAQGIIPVTADAHGMASWHWQVEGKAPTGTWPLTVTASLINGSRTTKDVNVTVTLPPINMVASNTLLSVPPKTLAILTISTAPFVNCTLTLNYLPNRTKTFKGTTDARGIVSWAWRVEAGAPPGVHPLTVTVTTGSGQQTSAVFNLTIQ